MSWGPQFQNDQYYHSKWLLIVNVMKNSNLRISRIAPAGSRATHRHRLDSDMDVIFATAGNPSRELFYPQLIPILRRNFPSDKIYPGGQYHVVHLDFNTGGKFDLVLLSEYDFDREHQDILQYRRDHL